MALGRREAAAYTSIAHALADLGRLTYIDERRFDTADACLELVRARAFDVVVMPNPYGNERRLEIYRLLKESKVPLIAFDRGGLPGSWFFDVGFNADSPSYHARNWDHPLTPSERAQVRDYMERVRTELSPLEDQGPRIGAARLRQKLAIGDRKVLLVPLQRPSDTTVRHFAAPMRDFDDFTDLVAQVGELTKVQLEDWVVVSKRHPLETSRPSLPVTFAPDDTHINDLIELADAVLVLNSGTGLLSLCWDKPVLIAGTAYYADPRLNCRVKSVEEVSEALSVPKAPDAETRDRFIHHLTSSVYSFGAFHTELVKQPDGAWRNITRRIDFDSVRFPAIRKRPSILFVTSVIPWPITRGAAHRTDQMLRALSAGDPAVDVLCLNQSEANTPDADIVARLRAQYPGLRHIMVRRHPKLARSLRASDLARRMAYQVAHIADGVAGRAHTINCAAHCPPDFARELDARLRQVPYAAIWFNYLRVMPPDLATDAKVICDLHDYQTERIRADVLPRLRASRRARYLQRFRESEARALGRCDLAIAISSVEMQRIVDDFAPRARVICVPATDFARVPPAAEKRDARTYDLLFVGARSDANIAGITWFLQDCFPLITATLPQVRLRIHGAVTEMPPLTQLMARLPESGNITMTGPSAAMDDVYASARVVICPIRHGTGMKIKMIEAMAYGMAIVATGKAGEGIATDLGLAFADEPEAFAEACRRLIEDPRARARSEQAARATFARDHEYAQLGDRLARALAELGIG